MIIVDDQGKFDEALAKEGFTDEAGMDPVAAARAAKRLRNMDPKGHYYVTDDGSVMAGAFSIARE